MPNVEAVIAKHNASPTAESAPEASSAPPAGTSGADSAVADVEAAGGNQSPASPTATNAASPDHDQLRAKLAHDRKLRSAKQLKREAKVDREAAAAARKAAEDDAAHWKSLGKDKSWLDAVKASGRDPREVYAEMQKEALKAGTPDAQIEAANARIAALEKKISDDAETTKKANEERSKKESATAQQRAFATDFQRGMGDPRFAPLLEEYEPAQLFAVADSLRSDPRRLFTQAGSLSLSLTHDDGTYTMLDILNVMRATQAAHHEGMQRRKTNAASQSSTAAPKQAPAARPPVNGTVAREADPVTITNDLADSNASAREQREAKLRKMTREERRTFLEQEFPEGR